MLVVLVTLLCLDFGAGARTQSRTAGNRRRAGPLIAVGGGGTTETIVRKALDLAGGPNGQPVAGRNLKLTILRDGMSFSLR